MRLTTAAELAEQFQITEQALLALRRRHDWPCVRLGRQIRFNEQQVALIVDLHTVRPEYEPRPSTPRSGLTARSAAYQQRKRLG